MRAHEFLYEGKTLGNLKLRERLNIMFKQRGFRQIGRGSYAAVFSNGKNVIKVYREDHAYETFIEYVRLHPSIHFPRIVSAPQPLKGTDLTMVRLERLTPLDSQVGDDIEAIMSIPDWQEKGLGELSDHAQTAIVKRNLDMFRTLAALMNFAFDSLLFTDIQPHNFMMRGNVIVITDPLVG